MRGRRLGRREALVGLSSAWLCTRAADAEDCPAERLEMNLVDIAAARASVTTLTGPFVQERRIGLLSAKVRSTGILTLVRPDSLRWELLPPDEAVYWVVPEGLAYQNRTGRGRVPGVGDKIAGILQDTRIILGGDLGHLRARYSLRGLCSDNHTVVFEAVPRPGQATAAAKIIFSLESDLVSPRSVLIVEGPRDQTELTFGPMQKNTPVDPRKMRAPL